MMSSVVTNIYGGDEEGEEGEEGEGGRRRSKTTGKSKRQKPKKMMDDQALVKVLSSSMWFQRLSGKNILFRQDLSDCSPTSLMGDLESRQLVRIDFGMNRIGDPGCLALASALKSIPGLTELNLETNFIQEEGAASLAEILIVQCPLRYLNLYRNKVGPKGASKVAQALTINTTLTWLNLSDNAINATGSIALAEALLVNTSLTQLDIRSNMVGNQGAVALSQALVSNTILSFLGLDSNQITDKGGVALASAFLENEASALTYLSLWNNDIQSTGAAALIDSLKLNINMTSLFLEIDRANKDLDPLLKVILDRNQHNTRMRHLTLFELLLSSSVLSGTYN